MTGTALPQTAGTGGITRMDEQITPNNTVRAQIEGVILPTIPRQNLEDLWPDASEVGLVGYHKAHLWGPGFGDEAACGIMYAHGSFNIAWQEAVERRIIQLNWHVSAAGGRVHVVATAQSFPRSQGGGRLLSQVKYDISVIAPDGRRQWVATIELTVPPPPPRPPFPHMVAHPDWVPVIDALRPLR